MYGLLLETSFSTVRGSLRRALLVYGNPEQSSDSWGGWLVEGSWTEGCFSTGQMACADLIKESIAVQPVAGNRPCIVKELQSWSSCGRRSQHKGLWDTLNGLALRLGRKAAPAISDQEAVLATPCTSFGARRNA